VRTLRVMLDTNQYHADITEIQKGSEDIYSTFNLLVRRRPQENNFKAVCFLSNHPLRELLSLVLTTDFFLSFFLFSGIGDHSRFDAD